MNKIIADTLNDPRIGDPQEAGRLTAFALLLEPNGGPDHMTLAEPFEPGTVSITEMSEGGSVPELQAVNIGETPVLAPAAQSSPYA